MVFAKYIFSFWDIAATAGYCMVANTKFAPHLDFVTILMTILKSDSLISIA